VNGPAGGLARDVARRASAAAARLDDGAEVRDVHPLPGGQSSLTFVATLVTPRARQRIVVKVAPPGLPPVRNRDVLRQATILRALSGVPGMKVPRVVFEDAGEPPEVPPLFAMTHVAGTSMEPHLTHEEEAAESIDGRARHAARLLALLHRQRPDALGITESPTALSSELDRWDRALATVTEITGDTSALVARLRASMPDDEPPRIVHGDFRLGNMLARADRIEAVIDWEIWSVTDPRVDLAWFALCGDAAWHPTAVRDHPGMPPASALVEEYSSAGGPATMQHAAWFRALALTKMGASTALIAKHHQRRGEDDIAATTAAPVATMLRRADRCLDTDR